MEKAEESGSDPHFAMLIYRSTPIRPGQLSPAELLTQRKYSPAHSPISTSQSGEQQRSANRTETDPGGLLQSESQAASGSTAIPECSITTGS